jgi:hypothetical protein
VTEVAESHVSMLSRPEATIEAIVTAAEAVG